MVSKQQFRHGKETNLRHVWLASLGAIVVARREGRDVACKTIDRAAQFGKQASRFGVDARDVARGGVLTLREQIEPKMAELGAELGTRLQPVLVKLGIGQPVRTARKATKARRSGSGRKPGKRAVRGV